MVGTGERDTTASTGAQLERLGWRFYGICLEDQPRRRAYLEAELARHGIQPRLHHAVRPTDAGGFPTIGYRGCFESHLACLHMAREDGARIAVIAEDDVMVMSAFDRSAVAIDRWLGERDWSVLYLGYLEDQSPAWHEPVRSVGPYVVESSGWHIQGCHFYAVNHTALDALIANFEERLAPGGHRISPDGVVSEFHRDGGIRPLMCVPNLAHQAPRVSSKSPTDTLKGRILDVPAGAALVEQVKRAQRERRSRRPMSAVVSEWNRRAADRTRA